MLYREIMAVCSEIHTKHINNLCGQNTEFVNVKPGVTYIWTLRVKHKGKNTSGFLPFLNYCSSFCFREFLKR